jgi:hypothetical protein
VKTKHFGTYDERNFVDLYFEKLLAVGLKWRKCIIEF